ncbi:hypothetical protein [Mesorhizobium amorphae]|uniref:Uncharacterized protein n=1 Tax=Mesorhizobium amorphae CCNWGS0123 TaxID=1082933 RepID=G6Y387_9HYPH|nr:hypothetical protein [Mesorhizobium amorphae]ANT51859.1 hypothetical protein A6B35_19125 [Mesorhizobium amorphae CCNWGS0123]EHH13747.1 hypothetical protein MEA186_01913 [Mesorhizobium amorphae CCNWGS0123]GLR44484.1 hypothetical protein GCM10007880_50010 [Mesorhizobium amorphae]
MAKNRFEAGKPAFALPAERGTGRYVGSAFINANREVRERLVATVKHLRGEDDLRHASLQDFREE